MSNDMRTLLASGAPLAKLPVDYFVYHVGNGGRAGSCVGRRFDGMVFTAGIGERSREIRSQVNGCVARLLD